MLRQAYTAVDMLERRVKCTIIKELLDGLE